jgi:PII-like signaling protein
VRSSVLLRGAEGFGAKHAARTDRLLTLSEDLPMVLVAIDEPARVAELAAEMRGIGSGGLLTLERLTSAGSAEPDGAQRLTVIVGRRERSGGGYAHEMVVERMRAGGMRSATALLGVDGTSGGERARARFFARNARVPMMIVGVGEADATASAVEGIAAALPAAPMMLAPVRIRTPGGDADQSASGPQDGRLCRLSVYAAEDVRRGDRTLHGAIVRALRSGGAPGVSTLRGQWGYDGPAPPSGERIAALGRHAPMITMVLDTPSACARWLRVIHEIIGQDAVVTSERTSAA